MSCDKSTILPNGECTVLPISPTNGQVFIDKENVKWIFNADSKFWEKSGTVATIPLATEYNNGYMSYKDKQLIDSIPLVHGGFGIITDAKLLLRSPTNPEGVIYGDIKLKSESLDIVCVGSEGVKSNCVVQNIECATSIENSPGLALKLSDKFLDTLIINLRGPKGKKGLRGEKGDPGKPGFVGGPAGDAGLPGDDITQAGVLAGIKYRDIEGLTDKAVVEMSLVNSENGTKLLLRKGKLNIPDNVIASKVVALPLKRGVIYQENSSPDSCAVTRLRGWRLTKDSGDETPLNLSLLRLSGDTEDITTEPVSFNSNLTLRQFISEVVNVYVNKLTSIDEEYGKVTKEYIERLDDKARTILSGLANELTLCEFNMPSVEFGMTFRGCDQPPSPSLAAADCASNNVSLSGKKISEIIMGVNKWDIKQ